MSDNVEVLEQERWRPCRAVTASVRAAGQSGTAWMGGGT